MGEDDGGDVVVVKLQILLVVKQSVRQSPPSRDGHRSEEDLPRHVPQGVQAGDVGVLELVHQDVPGLVQVKADVLTPESVSVGSSSDSPEEDVSGWELLAIVELDLEPVTHLLNLLHHNVLLHLHATLLNLLRHGLAYLERKSRYQY